MKTFKMTRNNNTNEMYGSIEGVSWLLFGNKCNTKTALSVLDSIDEFDIGDSTWLKVTIGEIKVERVEYKSEIELKNERENEDDYSYYDSSKGGFW